MAAPASTSLRKCMPNRILEAAMLRAQNSRPTARSGFQRLSDSATANAVMVWPEGKENRSGGSRVAQQCGSKVQGRRRPVAFFKVRKMAMPEAAARAAAPTARKRMGPPKSSTTAPRPYQVHEQHQIQGHRRRQNRIPEQAVHLDLHRVAQPAEDIDV